MGIVCVFFFKQKTAYEMRISDWSSDVCSSDLFDRLPILGRFALRCLEHAIIDETVLAQPFFRRRRLPLGLQFRFRREQVVMDAQLGEVGADHLHHRRDRHGAEQGQPFAFGRSEEHTSELQSLMRISYAVFCLKKTKKTNTTQYNKHQQRSE